jgi:Fibronectin type III domain
VAERHLGIPNLARIGDEPPRPGEDDSVDHPLRRFIVKRLFTISLSSALCLLGTVIAAPAATASSVSDAPTIVLVYVGSGAAYVHWTLASDGGSPITDFTVTASPGGHVSTNWFPNDYPVPGGFVARVDGLTDGTPCTFRVVATNAIGDSPPSAPSAPVIPSIGSLSVPPDGAVYTLGQVVYPAFVPTDASSVFKVEFWVDGSFVCFREFDPFDCGDDPVSSGLPLPTSTPGAHTIEARVFDASLNEFILPLHTYYVIDPNQSDVIAPAIMIVTPSDGASYTLGQIEATLFDCQDEAGGSGVATCTGDPIVDTSLAGTHTFTVSATDDAGNSDSKTHSYKVLAGSTSETVPQDGGTVTTDPGGIGPTPQVPVQTSVQTSTGGDVTINAGSPTGTPPSSYTFLGEEVVIHAPDAPDSDHPLVLTFSLDSSLNPDPSVIQVARNGVLVGACNPTVTNLPCAQIPTGVDAEGDLTIAVYTLQASTWNFAVHAPYVYGGFFQPVDNHALNKVKAGAAVPMRFSLGGDQGLRVLAVGYPASQKVDCDSSLPIDAIEQTVNAGSSSLTFSSASAQYTYVWKTQSSWAGTCRTFTLKLADGTVHTSSFKFPR